ncbi:carbonate dehydratase related protein, partial [mine drainage metagenome]
FSRGGGGGRVVAEGAVVKSGTKIAPESIAAGVPASVIGKISEDYKKLWTEYKANYNSFASRYRQIKKI